MSCGLSVQTHENNTRLTFQNQSEARWHHHIDAGPSYQTAEMINVQMLRAVMFVMVMKQILSYKPLSKSLMINSPTVWHGVNPLLCTCGVPPEADVFNSADFIRDWLWIICFTSADPEPAWISPVKFRKLTLSYRTLWHQRPRCCTELRRINQDYRLDPGQQYTAVRGPLLIVLQ